MGLRVHFVVTFHTCGVLLSVGPVPQRSAYVWIHTALIRLRTEWSIITVAHLRVALVFNEPFVHRTWGRRPWNGYFITCSAFMLTHWSRHLTMRHIIIFIYHSYIFLLKDDRLLNISMWIVPSLRVVMDDGCITHLGEVIVIYKKIGSRMFLSMNDKKLTYHTSVLPHVCQPVRCYDQLRYMLLIISVGTLILTKLWWLLAQLACTCVTISSWQQ